MASTDPLRPSLAPLEWVRPPQQARSQKTFERLLDAAEECAVQHGVQALTVSMVVSRARSSVGAFYARFSDKAALLNILHERDCARAMATADAALDPARWNEVDLPEAMSQLVEFCVKLYSEREKLVIGFLGLSATVFEFSERRARLSEHVTQKVCVFLRARVGEFSHRNVDLAARVMVRLLFGTLEAEIAHRNAAGVDRRLGDEELAAELTRASLGYLGVPVSRRITVVGAGSSEGEAS